MSIYPYVYRLDHPITGEFYIGVRLANKVPAEQDLGHKYFTSSKYVKPRFHEFTTSIVAEFFDKESAYHFEKELISENFTHNLCLNRALNNSTGGLKFSIKGHNEETKKKLSEMKKGHIPWNKGKVGVQKGTKWTLERREKIVNKLKGRKFSESHRQNLSESSKLKILSEDHRSKIGHSLKESLKQTYASRICRVEDRKEMSTIRFLSWLSKQSW